MQRLKLLLYIHNISGGGAERVCATLANELVARGHDVSIALDINYPFAYPIDKRIQLYDLYRGIPRLHTFINRCISLCTRYKNIRSIARYVKPELIISFMLGMNNEVILNTLGLSVPVICTEHITVELKQPFMKRNMRKLLYPFADAVTVLTRHDYLLWKCHPNVVRMPNPSPPQKGIILDNRKKVVLSAGRIDGWYHKGFDNLIRVWSKLCHRYPEWKLQICGSYTDSSFRYLSAIINETQCINVEFIGFRKDFDEILAKSAVFIMTSRFEGFPMVLVEAMNAQCCCVSFDCTAGPSDIIQDGYSGLLVEDQNNEKMVEALDKVLSDENYRKELASHSKESVEKYSTFNIVNRWENLFVKILQRKSSLK